MKKSNLSKLNIKAIGDHFVLDEATLDHLLKNNEIAAAAGIRINSDLTLGKVLKLHRFMRDMTLKQLSAASQVQICQLSKIERGLVESPSSKTISRLISVLGENFDLALKNINLL